MSLIYEALAKAEKDVRETQNKEPSVDKPIVLPVQKKKPRIFLFVIVFVVAGCVAGAYYFHDNTRSVDVLTSLARKVKPIIADVQQTIPLPTQNDKNPQSLDIQVEEIGITKKQIPVEAPADEMAIHVEVLAQEDNALPALELSGIIWDESSSLAIINGKILSVGDTVSEDVTIKEINKSSVTILFQDQEYVLVRE